MRRTSIALVVLFVAGCGGPAAPSGARTPPATVAAEPSASVTPGGCGSTPVRYGAFPSWAADAGLTSGMRYVMSHEGNLIGVLFANPLAAPPRADPGPHNKILWISKVPRDGNALRLTLTPAGGSQPVTVEQPADSSPGEIYPSIVDVPTAGCWTVSAEWGNNRATLELTYVPLELADKG